MKKKLYILLLFQTLIISAFGITVTTTAPNTGVSKVMTVDNGKVYELNFNTDVLSSSEVEVNIKELGLTIASQQITTNGNNALTFTPTSNAITIEFNRINSGTASLQFEVDNIQLKEVVSSKLTHEVGTKNYELSDHLGNVRTTVSDKKESGLSKVISANDYYPFGMEARSVSNGEYRFGFNGMHKDDEMTEGNYDFGARIYDSRLGRMLSIDPKVEKYPGLSPYQFAANIPTFFIDEAGENFGYNVSRNDNGGGTVTIETTIHLYGPQATEDLAKKVNESYAKLGTSGTYLDAKGNEWKIVVNAKFVYNEALTAEYKTLKEKHGAKAAFGVGPSLKNFTDEGKKDFNGGDNMMLIDVDHMMDQSWTLGLTTLGGPGGSMAYSVDGTIHEGLHAVGLDHLHPSSAKDVNDIMRHGMVGDGKDSPKTFSSSHIVNFGSFLENQGLINSPWPGAGGPDNGYLENTQVDKGATKKRVNLQNDRKKANDAKKTNKTKPAVK